MGLTPAVCDRLAAAVSRGGQITVVGIASPDGSDAANMQLALRRARSQKSLLCRLANIAPDAVTTEGRVAAWSDLRQLVAADKAVPCRDEVLHLLDSAQTAGWSSLRLTRSLRQFREGTPYLYIRQNLLPVLRTTLFGVNGRPQFRPSLADMSRAYREEAQDVTAQNSRISDQQAGRKKISEFSEPQNSPDPPKTNEEQANQNAQETQQNQINHNETPSQDEQKEPASQDEQKEPASQEEQNEPASQEEPSSVVWLYWLAIVLLVALVVDLLLRLRKYVSRTSDLEAQLELKDNELSLLRSKNQALMDDYEAARRQIADMENIKQLTYDDGAMLYRHLEENGSAAEWSNRQVRTFIDYYRIQNSALIERLEKEYDKLSPNNMLFIILQDMGKSDHDIQHIMSISQTTIRSIRFRIRAKKI